MAKKWLYKVKICTNTHPDFTPKFRFQNLWSSFYTATCNQLTDLTFVRNFNEWQSCMLRRCTTGMRFFEPTTEIETIVANVLHNDFNRTVRLFGDVQDDTFEHELVKLCDAFNNAIIEIAGVLEKQGHEVELVEPL